MGDSSSARWGLLKTVAVWATLLSNGLTSTALAVSRNYTIDQTQSSIAISGTVFSADLNQTRTIVEQGTGSLTSKYTGTLQTDRVTNSISFLSGSSIDATVNGNWQPKADATAGSEAADYGGRANFVVIIIPTPVFFAGRDLIADVASAPITISGNQFDLSTTNLTFTSGDIAYRANADIADSATIVGEGNTLAGNGTLGLLSQGGSVYETLTIPIDASFSFGDASATINLNLDGQIVAKYLIPASNGDYNKNGIVDAADYVVWRDTSGQSGVGLAADGNGDGQVTPADYTLWRSKFGQNAGSGAGGELSMEGAVPEPGCALLLLTAVAAGVLRCGRSRATV